MARISKNNPAARQAGNAKPICCEKEMTAVKYAGKGGTQIKGMFWLCEKCKNRFPTR